VNTRPKNLAAVESIESGAVPFKPVEDNLARHTCLASSDCLIVLFDDNGNAEVYGSPGVHHLHDQGVLRPVEDGRYSFVRSRAT
jgi:hypothetical protein